MEAAKKSNRFFLGIMAAIVLLQLMLLFFLWRDFFHSVGSFPEVFAAVSPTIDSDVARNVTASETLQFSFVVPRGEAVKFLEVLGPHMSDVAWRVGRQSVIDLAVDELEVLSRVESGHVFAGSLSANTYGANRQKRRVKAFLERTGQVPRQSLFLVKQESPFKTLADLRGTRIAFKTRESLTGYLLALQELEVASLTVRTDDFFSRQVFTGNLENSVWGLLQGEYDCAVVSTTFFEEIEPEKKRQIRVVHRSRAVPGGVYVTAANADPVLVSRVASEMIALGRTIPSSQELAGLLQVKIPDEAAYSMFEQGLGGGTEGDK